MSWSPPARKTARYALGELLRDHSDHFQALSNPAFVRGPRNGPGECNSTVYSSRLKGLGITSSRVTCEATPLLSRRPRARAIPLGSGIPLGADRRQRRTVRGRSSP
jgi:hypothetical protein